MFTGAGLRRSQRAGIVFAIAALAISVGHANLHVRRWLRDDIAGGGPPWMDHLLFMLTLKIVVWGTIGLLVLGPRALGLYPPERRRGEAALVATLSGALLVPVVWVALRLSGAVKIDWAPDWPLILGNVYSNFMEELINRGAILGLLLQVLGRTRAPLAALLSAALFCQGHLHNPGPMVAATLMAGLLWAGMTLRYGSIWPAWWSHTVVDALADSMFVS
jgi:membrane protease YdiL (CAAX protease family)